MITPQKILIIKDLTFILPPTFNGNLGEALTEYVKYRDENLDNNRLVDACNSLNCTEFVLANDDTVRSCILYGIVEISEDGTYKILESSSSTINPNL